MNQSGRNTQQFYTNNICFFNKVTLLDCILYRQAEIFDDVDELSPTK